MGEVAEAFTFSGSGYVQVLRSPTLEPAQITVDAWVRAAQTPGSFRYIVSEGGLGDTAAPTLSTPVLQEACASTSPAGTAALTLSDTGRLKPATVGVAAGAATSNSAVRRYIRISMIWFAI